MRICLPANDPQDQPLREFLDGRRIVMTKIPNSYDSPFEEFYFDGDVKDLVEMVLEFWGIESVHSAFGGPYQAKDGMLEGPLDQPADLMDIQDVDGFTDWVNGVYDKGVVMGMAIERDLVRHELKYVSRDRVEDDFSSCVRIRQARSE